MNQVEMGQMISSPYMGLLSDVCVTVIAEVAIAEAPCCSAHYVPPCLKGSLFQRILPFSLVARGFASYPPHTVLDMPALSPTMAQVAHKQY